MPQDHKKNISLRFEPDGITTMAKQGTTVFRVAMDTGAGLRSECGGKGRCGKCLIQTMSPNILTAPEESEITRLGLEHAKQGFRLACQAQLRDEGVIEIIPESQTRQRKMQLEGKKQSFFLNPSYSKVLLDLEEPTLADQRSDIDRISAGVQKILGLDDIDISPSLLRIAPKIFRDTGWKLIATVKNAQEIVELLPQPASEAVLGIAVDLGTSKIVTHLIDLTSGNTIGIRAIENPQLPYGEDVISRIHFAGESPNNLRSLSERVIASINSSVDDLLNQAYYQRNDAYSLVIVGNSPMLHLFIGADPQYLAKAPFVSLFSDFMEVNKEFSGIRIHPEGTVTILPSISGFVGSDCVAVVLSTGIDETEELSLAVDVGTNTEIVLGNHERMTVVSCASGPAFEGVHIENGIKAVEGAVEHLRISPVTYKTDYEVIGNTEPIGLCGSAMIDCIAELMRTRLIDFSGRLRQDSTNSYLIGEGKARAFVIVPADESGTGRPIVITQKDIRNLQTAKAAILTGCFALLRLSDVKLASVRHVYLAGAFGNQVNPENAKIMGLLPDFPPDIVEFVGNAAIEGAKLCLLDRNKIQQARDIAQRMTHFELAADKQFHKEFPDAMFLPHRNLERFPSVKKILQDHLN
ncbi:MAG: ASKHA domain-containing protein [Candidatus Hodarchaeales archaeon]|jgi:uncharacterized 2Fe-2S/4Fe-4S cluster protein (DUF4445 family)